MSPRPAWSHAILWSGRLASHSQPRERTTPATRPSRQSCSRCGCNGRRAASTVAVIPTSLAGRSSAVRAHSIRNQPACRCEPISSYPAPPSGPAEARISLAGVARPTTVTGRAAGFSRRTSVSSCSMSQTSISSVAARTTTSARSTWSTRAAGTIRPRRGTARPRSAKESHPSRSSNAVVASTNATDDTTLSAGQPARPGIRSKGTYPGGATTTAAACPSAARSATEAAMSRATTSTRLTSWAGTEDLYGGPSPTSSDRTTTPPTGWDGHR